MSEKEIVQFQCGTEAQMDLLGLHSALYFYAGQGNKRQVERKLVSLIFY